MQSPIVKAAKSPRPPRVSLWLIGACAVVAFAVAGSLVVDHGVALVHSRAFAVMIYTTLGALMTGIGCVPLAWLPRIDASNRNMIMGQAGAITAGAMAFASLDLLLEGVRSQVTSSATTTCMIGFVAGCMLVALTDSVVRTLDVSIGDWKGADHRQAILILIVMTLHSFAEGMGIGVSFSDDADRTLGPFIALSIGLHNIAEGAIIALSLVPRGESLLRASVLAVTSSLPQPIVALPFFALVQDFNALLPFGLGAAAGAMFYLVGTEIAPDAVKYISPAGFVTTASCSAAFMGMLRHLLSSF